MTSRFREKKSFSTLLCYLEVFEYRSNKFLDAKARAPVLDARPESQPAIKYSLQET